MAFLFVVHVPYTPRPERLDSDEGDEKEETEKGEGEGEEKTADDQEETIDEDDNKKDDGDDDDGWIGSQESLAKSQNSETDNVSQQLENDNTNADVEEPNPGECTAKSNKTDVHPGVSASRPDEGHVNSKNNTAESSGVQENLAKTTSKFSVVEVNSRDTAEKSVEGAIKSGETGKNSSKFEGNTALNSSAEEKANVENSQSDSSPSKCSDSSEGKKAKKKFDVKPVEEKEIQSESEASMSRSSTVNSEIGSKDVDDDSEKSESDDKEKDDEKSGGEEEDNNEDKSAEEKHLTPLIEFDPIHEQVLRVLKNCQVENVSQQRVGEGKLIRFSFIKEDSKNCEEILHKLKSLDVGQKPDSSISVFPTTVHVCYTEEESTEASTPDVEKEPSLEAQEKESKFRKSIKSRLIVQQVVDSVRSNAEFTFDYLLLIVLASLIACLGLVENSSVVLVASMLISPLMGPILAGTFGHVIKVYELRNLGVKSEIKGLIICVVIGFLFGLIAGGISLHGAAWGSSNSWPTIEMKSRGMLRSLWVGVLIAVPSGAGVAIGVLGGNAGSLVGVAISASLLPPAVNAGMLWAYGMLAAINPPDVITNSVISTTVVPTITSNYSSMSPNITITSTSLPPSTQVPESCLPLVNNEYQQFYSCNVSHDAALLGLVSLFLTILNITCIFFMGIIVLKIKEVAPYDAAKATVNNFWHEDVKVARTYYETTKGPSSKDLGKKILTEWQKFKSEQQPKEIADEQQKLQQNVETVNCINYLQHLENDPMMQRIMARISPSDTCLGYAQDLQSEYERAKDHVDEQYSKDPAIYLSRYQPKATNQRIEKAYHTVHLVRDEESKPSLAELRGRFQKGQSLYIESEKLGSPLGISVNKKAKRSFSLSMPSQNKLFKRRRVKFEETVTEEAENFV